MKKKVDLSKLKDTYLPIAYLKVSEDVLPKLQLTAVKSIQHQTSNYTISSFYKRISKLDI